MGLGEVCYGVGVVWDGVGLLLGVVGGVVILLVLVVGVVEGDDGCFCGGL